MKKENKKIRVGIIGVNPDRGWAATAHIPALKSLSQYEIMAISNRNESLANLARERFGIPMAFTSNQDLIESPELDLIIVTVRVSDHKELVTAALNAGKHVYCEWPLGIGLQEVTDMTELANKTNRHGAIGLQVRAVPAVNYIKDLVETGYLGEILSTSMIGSGLIQGAFIEQAFAYAADIKNGAGILYSTLGNTVDALCYCLGEFKYLNATAVTRRKSITVVETGKSIPMTAYDQIAVNGELLSGAVTSIHYRGGMSQGTNFLWEINGSKGDLVATADGGHPGVFELTIRATNEYNKKLELLRVPHKYNLVSLEPAGGPAFNLAQNYYRLAKDLNEGTHLSANFDDALTRHQMTRAIELSSVTGERQYMI